MAFDAPEGGDTPPGGGEPTEPDQVQAFGPFVMITAKEWAAWTRHTRINSLLSVALAALLAAHLTTDLVAHYLNHR